MDSLGLREAFHLAFLRDLVRSVPLSSVVLKGGSNLRFFYGSPRYSEDMDPGARGMPVHVLRDNVMSILASKVLGEALRTFGVQQVVPPRVSSAKQTETVQRFKVHLLTAAGEDLSTRWSSPSASRAASSGGVRQRAGPQGSSSSVLLPAKAF